MAVLSWFCEFIIIWSKIGSVKIICILLSVVNGFMVELIKIVYGPFKKMELLGLCSILVDLNLDLG